MRTPSKPNIVGLYVCESCGGRLRIQIQDNALYVVSFGDLILGNCSNSGLQVVGDFLPFRPVYRVAEFDEFFDLRGKFDVPGEFTGFFVESGRLI